MFSGERSDSEVTISRLLVRPDKCELNMNETFKLQPIEAPVGKQQVL